MRHWSGPSPRRLVLDRQHPLNLESLYHHNVQSLIVEGGRKTLDTFLAQNLWDEIRVETNLSLTVSGGTRAPQLPANAQPAGQPLQADHNIISVYRINS